MQIITAIREEVLHSIKLGQVEVVVDSNQLKLLSLYLAFVINETDFKYPFILKTFTNQSVLINRNCEGINVHLCAYAPDPIISSFLSEDVIKDLSSLLVTYSANTIHAPELYDYTAYQNKDYAEDYGGWILKDEDHVIRNVPCNPNSTCALYVDNDKEFIYGIDGYTTVKDGSTIPVRI